MFKYSKKDIEKWVLELRSGKYEQGREALNEDNSYCCLGVACKVFIEMDKLEINNRGNIRYSMPVEQSHSPTWLKLINEDFQSKTGLTLVGLNDGIRLDKALDNGLEHETRFTFNEIADLLEAVYVLEVLK